MTLAAVAVFSMLAGVLLTVWGFGWMLRRMIP